MRRLVTALALSVALAACGVADPTAERLCAVRSLLAETQAELDASLVLREEERFTELRQAGSRITALSDELREALREIETLERSQRTLIESAAGNTAEYGRILTADHRLDVRSSAVFVSALADVAERWDDSLATAGITCPGP